MKVEEKETIDPREFRGSREPKKAEREDKVRFNSKY